MQYVNFVYKTEGKAVLHAAPVAENHAAYLRQVAKTLCPLSDEDYMNGPAAILHTAARFSYVLDNHQLYWCIEWDPGFVVLRFSPTGEIEWTTIRSPVPNFGGREATEAEMDAYDEDEENPQYKLIFDPWDAQFDDEKRKRKSFAPADQMTSARFEAALAHANELSDVIEQRFADDEAWSRRCKENLKRWAGEGVRLTPPRA